LLLTGVRLVEAIEPESKYIHVALSWFMYLLEPSLVCVVHMYLLENNIRVSSMHCLRKRVSDIQVAEGCEEACR
jgi:hypothetical protein